MTFFDKFKIILIITLALIISIFTYKYLNSLKAETTIVIAVEDIKERTWIKPEMLKVVGIRKREKNILAPDAVSDIKELENAISRVKISKGKSISRTSDVIAGTKQSLIQQNVITEDGSIDDSYFISNNKRVVTIKLDSSGAVDNKLKIGDWVDVVFTNMDNGKNSFSSTILQHIEVFNVQNVKEKGAKSQNISLIVTPQQALDITFAKRMGKVDLILNPSKGENELIFPTTMKKFLQPFVDEKVEDKE